MRAVIELENMEFHAGHGCYELEKKVGNRFSVDLFIEYDATEASANDDISLSINYLDVYNVVSREMEKTSNILENVAKRIVDSVYSEFSDIVEVKVKVSKLAPPLGGKIEKVSVTFTR